MKLFPVSIPMKLGSTSIGLGVGVFSGFLWALNNLFFSLGYNLVPTDGVKTILGDSGVWFAIPIACAALNDCCAAISLLIFNGMRGLMPEICKSIKTKAALIICAAALLGGPVGQSAYFLGIALAGPAYALTITAMYPIVGCLLSWLFLKQPINMRMWLGIFISVIGAVIVGYIPDSASYDNFSMGILFSMLAAFCWGSEIVLAYYGMNEIKPDIAITLREFVSGTVLLFVVLPLINGIEVLKMIVNTNSAFPYFLGAGVVAGSSYGLWYVANKLAGCAKGMATNSTYIIWGVLLNVCFGGIAGLSADTIVGCILVLIGVILVLLNPLDFFR